MAKSTISDDPVRDQDKFMLRLPFGMRERIKDAADKNGRSMNSEIVATLEEAYPAASFNLGFFMEQWMAPIMTASAKDRPGLIENANQYLRTSGSDMLVSTEKKPGGKLDVILRMAGARMLVGDVGDLTILGYDDDSAD